MNELTAAKPTDLEQMEWLSLAKTGDSQAFSKLVEKYQQAIYNQCYRMLKDATEAEDASQETFLRAYTKLDSYDDTRLFSTWLFSIASHYCLDLLRKRQVRFIGWDKLLAGYSLGDETGPEKSVLEKEISQEVRALIGSLPQEQRAAIVLKYWDSMTYEEIAQSLNTTVTAIKSKLFRARKMMARRAAEQAQPAVAPNLLTLTSSFRA